MPKLKTRNWAAFENRQPPVNPEAVPFYVTGQVETVSGNIRPVLRPANPQGINPSILILELTLEDSGGGGTDDVSFRDTRYDESIRIGQYTEVDVRHGSENVTLTPVRVVQ
jgi:hypothetical protein